jgi:hypothetical protein
MIFQCNKFSVGANCEPWETNSGANAVLFLNAGEQTDGLTPLPPGAQREIEARVTGWGEQDDLVTPDLEPAFYSAGTVDAAGRYVDAYGKFYDTHEAVVDSVCGGAKVGGVPGWVQYPEDVAPGFHFAAQLAMYLHFPDPLPTADEAQATINFSENTPFRGYVVTKPAHPDPALRGEIYVSDLTYKRYGSGFDVEAADFGDGGEGYLFIRPDPETPQGLFLWQCG